MAHPSEDPAFDSGSEEIPLRGVETFRHPWRNLLLGLLLGAVGAAITTVVMRRSGDAALREAVQRAELAVLNGPGGYAGTLKNVADPEVDRSIIGELHQLDQAGAFSSGAGLSSTIDGLRTRLRTGRLVLGSPYERRASDLVRSPTDHKYSGVVAFHSYLISPDQNDGHINGFLDAARFVQFLASGMLVDSRFACSLMTKTLDQYEERLGIEATRASQSELVAFGKQDAEFRAICAGIDIVEASKLSILREPLFSPDLMGELVEGTRVWDVSSIAHLTGAAQRESAALIVAYIDILAAIDQSNPDDVVRDLEFIEQRMRSEGEGIVGDIRLPFARSIRDSQPLAARLLALPPAPTLPR